MGDQADARRRDAIERERLAIRREEHEMEHTAAEMEAEGKQLEHDIEAEEEAIDQALRSQHFGRPPEHPPSWDAAPDED